MDKARSEEIHEILGQKILGYDDSVTNEGNGYSMQLDKNSDTVEKLKKRGFKVIYPAKLKDDSEIANGHGGFIEGKYLNEVYKDNAFIIDSKEKLSLDLAAAIAGHYFSETRNRINGLDTENNTLTFYENENAYADGTNEGLKKILDEIGFQTQMDEYGRVTASSDIPYPAVQKSKFENIYNKAKGKIKETFSKIKSLVHPKEKAKDNDKDLDVK